MQAYQEEYISNLKDIALLSIGRKANGCSFEEYFAALRRDREQLEQKVKRNMLLLRENLFPVLDRLPEAPEEDKRDLEEFASKLSRGSDELDLGLFCEIHKAQLRFARQTKNRDEMIKELYWLGIGFNSLSSKLTGLEDRYVEKYHNQMRLCFTEAAAYLKYYDDIDDADTRGYILRSRANMSLGKFKTVGEKIYMVKRGLMILRDEGYQKKNPELPWDKFIFLGHRQMVSSLPHTKESRMTPQNVADVMESVYIVYQQRQQEAEEKNEKLSAHSQFTRFSVEYYCGLHTFNDLLSKLEELMDDVDQSDFSAEEMYRIISLPAFYCQYLNQAPELIPYRKEYIDGLNLRVIEYVEAFPEETLNENLFNYLRQLSYTFIETGSGISYKDFLLNLQTRFAPSIYIHSWLVAKAAEAFCDIITDDEPDFFDDIDFIREITNPVEKKEAIKRYAVECGIFHDVGKINFMNLYSNMGRQWFEDEYEMAHLHTLIGMACLSKRNSTLPFAAVAQGHHSWYDGLGGYPGSYKRLECQYRQMVDVIGLVDWLVNVTDTAQLYTGREKTFDQAVEDAVALEGRRFSPLLTARLREKQICGKIKNAISEGRREVYYKMYEMNKEK